MHGLYQLLNMSPYPVNSAVHLLYNSPVLIRCLPTYLLNEFSQTKCVHQNCNSDWRLTTDIDRLSSKLATPIVKIGGGGYFKRKFILGGGGRNKVFLKAFAFYPCLLCLTFCAYRVPFMYNFCYL